MKKILILLFGFVFALTTIGCTAGGSEQTVPENEGETTAAETTEESEMNIPNPWKNLADLDAANACAGTGFIIPAEYSSNVTAYRAMEGEMLEIIMDIDGREVRVRTKNGPFEDISGDNNPYTNVYVIRSADLEVTCKSNNDTEIALAIWGDDTASYSVSFENFENGAAQEIISSIIISNSIMY